MSFNTLDELEHGNVKFVSSLLDSDYYSLIRHIRNSDRKKQVIDGFLDQLITVDPKFCFKVIYDIDEYKDYTIDILNKYISLLNNKEHFLNIVVNTSFGEKYIIKNKKKINFKNIINDQNILYKVVNSYPSILEIFIEKIDLMDDKNIILLSNLFLINFDNHFENIKKLSIHKNLHIRYLFMKVLVTNYQNKINLVYDDIMKYLTSYTHQQYEQLTFLPELIDSEDISNLANILYEQKSELWSTLKEYILENYKFNDLGEKLLVKGDIKEFEKNSNILFETSSSYKYQILKHYSKYLSEDICEHYFKYINMFEENDPGLRAIFNYDLFPHLEKTIDKYLSLSQEKNVTFLGRGTTCSAYKIGDYVIKLARSKWSYEDVICPNLYLILNNLEEKYIRNKDNTVGAGIEIQKYLKRSANNVDENILELFKDELANLGYYTTDTLINGECGDNCMLLDSYKDAYYKNPEELPDWFKETPMVLVDRDRVYKLSNYFPKQIKSGY